MFSTSSGIMSSQGRTRTGQRRGAEFGSEFPSDGALPPPGGSSRPLAMLSRVELMPPQETGLWTRGPLTLSSALHTTRYPQ